MTKDDYLTILDIVFDSLRCEYGDIRLSEVDYEMLSEEAENLEEYFGDEFDGT